MSSNEDGPTASDQLVVRALRQMIADLVDRLHDAIDAGLDVEALHNIAGLWEANNLNEELTYGRLAAAGTPTTCDDCDGDVMPYDDDGRPIEKSWEWYMVRSEVWEAARRDKTDPHFLCIGCLGSRIGRQLVPSDFANLDVNRPSWIQSERLIDRLGAA